MSGAWGDDMIDLDREEDDFVPKMKKSNRPFTPLRKKNMTTPTPALDALERLYDYAFSDENDKADYETIRAALLNAPQWQPIETAPRDETRILIHTRSGKQCVARYETHFFLGSAWVTYGNLGSSECYTLEKDGGTTPTHWMPLPPPPMKIEGGA